MNLNELRYILTVEEEKKISKAAEKLFIAQPSLSQIIKKNEAKIGYKLFIRRPSGIKLTREGKEFIKFAKKMIELKSELDLELRDISSSVCGQFKVGIPAFWGSYIMPRVLTDFQKQYKNIEIVIKEQTSSCLEAMILKEEIDVAIMTLPISFENEILCSELFKEEVLVAVSPENELSRAGVKTEGKRFQTLDPQLLKDQKFLIFPAGGRLKDISDIFFSKYEINPKIAAQVMTIETVQKLVAGNLGVAFLPSTTALLYDTSPKPVYFSLGEGTLPEWTVVVASKRRKSPNNLTRDFVKTVVNEYGNNN